MDTIRAFIAIELPEDVRTTLAAVQKRLQEAAPGAAQSVKWVSPAAIHLTLKFLGETPTAKIRAIEDALSQAATGRGTIRLYLAKAGCFPHPRNPRVLWVGIGGEVDALASLQTAVEETVSPLGFPAESRPFSPHLTLGRVRDDAKPEIRRLLGLAIGELPPPSAAFVARSISLMRSDLRPEGAVYTRLAEVPLGTVSVEPPMNTDKS